MLRNWDKTGTRTMINNCFKSNVKYHFEQRNGGCSFLRERGEISPGIVLHLRASFLMEYEN